MHHKYQQSNNIIDIMVSGPYRLLEFRMIFAESVKVQVGGPASDAVIVPQCQQA